MSTEQTTRWQKNNTKLIGLRLNQSKDSDIINYLEATGAPLQTIRRLVRDEIARTGWNADDSNKQA